MKNITSSDNQIKNIIMQFNSTPKYRAKDTVFANTVGEIFKHVDRYVIWTETHGVIKRVHAWKDSILMTTKKGFLRQFNIPKAKLYEAIRLLIEFEDDQEAVT